MRKTCRDVYGEKSRQLDRRTKAQPYRLANYQKRLWAERYLAARNRKEDVDYADLATKTQFKAFKDNPQDLQTNHQYLLKEVYAGYRTALKNKANADPNAALKELLASSHASLVTKL
ncbi:hypothetical protein V7S43_008497 [Phytophthora oleae]|uniref:Uncharacterized protein n=1 Tax=Phytophthora oleae TaxID=2107226 RepID=A0ABD3FII9_9STRA